MAVRAVAFEFITMSEAAHAVPAEIQQRHPGIPWDKMQVIRQVYGSGHRKRFRRWRLENRPFSSCQTNNKRI